MKVTLSRVVLALALSAVPLGSALAQSRTLSIDDHEAAVGVIVSVPVALDDGSGVEAASFRVLHDPQVLDYRGASKSTYSDSMGLSDVEDPEGTVRLELWGGELSPGAGDLVLLEYEVVGSGGQMTVLDLQGCASALNEGGIAATCEDGSLTVLASAPPCPDADADGFAVCDASCDDSGLICGDCDDAVGATYPDALETCNEVDDDCDGSVDEELALETYHRDADGDGYGDPNETTDTCASEAPSGYVANDLDCDDGRSDVNPNVGEFGGAYCDGVDNDCDGTVDEECASTRLIDVTEHEVKEGESVAVPVTIDDASGVSAVHLVVSHNVAVLRADDVRRGPLTAGMSLSWFESPTGRLTIDLYGKELGPGGGALVEIVYTAVGSTDDASAVVLDECEHALDEGAIASECSNGSVTIVTAYPPCPDADGDGYAECDGQCESSGLSCGDCDDAVGTTYPDAPETCNEVDDDCDGSVDEELALETYQRDADGDGYGDPNETTETCASEAPSGYVANDGDCDDSRSDVNPDVEEFGGSYCDGVDNDCDGDVDEECPGTRLIDIRDDHEGKPGDEVLVPVTLDDGTGVTSVLLVIRHDATRLSFVDASRTPYTSQMSFDVQPSGDVVRVEMHGAELSVGAGDLVHLRYAVLSESEPGQSAFLDLQECYHALNEGTIHAACSDGEIDVVTAYPPCPDADGDGYAECDGQCESSGLSCGDCDDAVGTTYPDALETCNEVDDDCDGSVDEELALETYQRDADGDGYGDPNETTETCASEAPAGYVANDGDCDDGRDDVYDSAPELCDGVDNDCNEVVDEGCPGAREISIEDDQIRTGDRLYVPVEIDDAQDVDAIRLVVAHDPAVLDLVIVRKSALTAEMNLSWSEENGIATIDLYGAEPLGIGPGVLVELVYDAIGEAGTGTPLELRDCQHALNEGRIRAECHGGWISVVESYPPCPDDDEDTYAACHERCDQGALECGDCEDLDASVHPGAPESCNEIDDDCDGSVDEGLATNTYYRDADDDTYGDPDPDLATAACADNPPLGYTVDDTDCDDANAHINPGVDEDSGGVVRRPGQRLRRDDRRVLSRDASSQHRR